LIPKLPPLGSPKPYGGGFILALAACSVVGVEGKTTLDVNGWTAVGSLGFSNWKMM
jgi:hypothetical protein